MRSLLPQFFAPAASGPLLFTPLLGTFIKSEIPRWGRLVRLSGITSE